MLKIVVPREIQENLLVIWGVMATALLAVALFALLVVLFLFGGEAPVQRVVIVPSPASLETVMEPVIAPATPPAPEPAPPPKQVAKRQVKPKPAVPKPTGVNYRLAEPGGATARKPVSPRGTVIQEGAPKTGSPSTDALMLPAPRVSREDTVPAKK